MDPTRGQVPTRQRLDLLALWILFSTWCSVSGWILSLLGALNAAGYVASLLALAGLILLLRRRHLQGTERTPLRRELRSRWKLPKIWFALTLLVLLGGLLYHPVNYDHLSYRFTRILFWAGEGHWFWIPTFANRMNYSAPGFEWLMMPQFVLFHTDRLFFLINFVSYLFLPGLIFSVFRRLGISPRICWWWMWVLPCGYCYILQAGGASNDSFAAIYLLAALHYALPAREESACRRLVLSLLAIALLTGAKASNLFLVLPWMVAVFLNRTRLFAGCRPFPLGCALVAAAVISFLPLAVINIHYTGDFAGDPKNEGRMKLTNPVSAVVGNVIQLAEDNLSLLLWYKPISWARVIPPALQERLKEDYPRFRYATGEMQIEEGAGLGLGIALAAAFMVLLRFRPGGRPRRIAPDRAALWIVAAGTLALFAYSAKMGSEAVSRLVAAYYPLVIAGVLVVASPDGSAVRRRLTRGFGSLVMLSALPLLVLNPSRPLFPVRLLVQKLPSLHIGPTAIERIRDVYFTYADRYDDFHDLRVLIPAGEKQIGFVHLGDEPEVSLWLPFGSREVIDVSTGAGLADLQAMHLHFIVVEQEKLDHDQVLLADLVKKWKVLSMSRAALSVKVHRGSEIWYILRVP